jgi:hypothetical protein
MPRGAPGLRGAGAAALALAAGAGFWALTRDERLFGAAGTGVDIEYALLLAPAAVLAPAALAGWWALPQLAQPLARGVAVTRSVVALEALRTIARRPAGAAFALVAIAAGAAAVTAALPGGLDRSPEERAAHVVGADLRASGLRSLAGGGEPAFRAAIAEAPSEAVSPAVRIDATLRPADGTAGHVAEEGVAIELLAVEPSTFGAVAAFREDFAPQPLDGMLAALATNATQLDGLAVPPGTRQLGAWVQLPELAGEVAVALGLRDGEGRSHQLLLGRLTPGALAQWGFLAADLETPFGLDGAPLEGVSLTEPLTIHAYYVRLDAAAAAAPGGVAFGPLLSTTDAPARPLDELDALVPAGTAFERRAILHDLIDIEGFEPIADLVPGAATEAVRATRSAPPGFEGASRLDWPAAAPGADTPLVRGLRQETDGAPVLLYASRAALDRLGAGAGGELRLEVAGRFLRAQVAGPLDHFPTLGLPTARAGGEAFAVAGLDRLLAAVNASPRPDQLRSEEAWFATSVPTATALALGEGGLDASLVVDRRAELAALTDARTLALGWRGVLTLGLGGLLALAAVAVIVDGVAAVRAAERAAALAEALGGAGAGALAASLVALLVRLVAAAALGLAAGVWLSRRLLEILAADAQGATIVPPPRIEAGAGPWLAAAAVLLAAFVVMLAFAALRYRGLSWHRALQLEEA